ncbi:uncharacterized protein LOC105183611 [Harpegnathos saltator]|uniref:uncharacterized protein LOC105183611 n=1 Tax=Harpegnathos saltator TaxID=610380 RepID=UPI000DBEDAE1|nr:uncharacterized protein LOC105183611 [Harpegnathos saltator]
MLHQTLVNNCLIHSSAMHFIRQFKWCMFSLFATAIIILYMMYLYINFLVTARKSPPQILFKETELMKLVSYEKHLLGKGFTYKQIKNMSLLGKWLLAPEKSLPPANNPKENYLILIWQHGKHLANRHIKRFSNKMSVFILNFINRKDCIL